MFEVCHLAASSYALVVQWRNWKVMLGVVLVYGVLAGVEALMAGSVVGLLYVHYHSGSTLMPSRRIPIADTCDDQTRRRVQSG